MSYSHSTLKLSIIALLFSIVALGQDHLFVGPIAPKTESAEHVALRIKYEATIKTCEADQPLDPARHRSDDPEFDKHIDGVSRSTNARIALQLAKNDLIGAGYEQRKAADVEYKLMQQFGVDEVLKDEETNPLPEATRTIARAFGIANMRVAACEQAERLEPKLDAVDLCVSTYPQTIDKKNADLTVRESERVKLCQSLDLYPPTK